jgi:hypothetical protein
MATLQKCRRKLPTEPRGPASPRRSSAADGSRSRPTRSPWAATPSAALCGSTITAGLTGKRGSDAGCGFLGRPGTFRLHGAERRCHVANNGARWKRRTGIRRRVGRRSGGGGTQITGTLDITEPEESLVAASNPSRGEADHRHHVVDARRAYERFFGAGYSLVPARESERVSTNSRCRRSTGPAPARSARPATQSVYRYDSMRADGFRVEVTAPRALL